MALFKKLTNNIEIANLKKDSVINEEFNKDIIFDSSLNESLENLQMLKNQEADDLIFGESILGNLNILEAEEDKQKEQVDSEKPLTPEEKQKLDNETMNAQSYNAASYAANKNAEAELLKINGKNQEAKADRAAKIVARALKN